jgi:hypothetical protein
MVVDEGSPRAADSGVPIGPALLIARLFVAAAFLIAVYLGLAAENRLPDVESDAVNRVFSESRWGHLIGVPIEFFGAAVYASLLLLSGGIVARSGGWMVSTGLGLALITLLGASSVRHGGCWLKKESM